MQNPQERTTHIVKIGGEQAINIHANLNALDDMRRHFGGEILAIVSALRGPRNGGFNTTDVLIAGAQNQRPVDAIQAIAEWTSGLEGVDSTVVERWREDMQGQIQRVLDMGVAFEAQEGSSDWRAAINNEIISITGMGEALAAQIYQGLASNHSFEGGYSPETGNLRGYSDHTAVLQVIRAAERGEAVCLHVHKNFPCMTANPETDPNAKTISDLWADEIEPAFMTGGFAYGVLQEAAVQNLMNSGHAIDVLIYNPTRPQDRTTVHFNQSRPSQMAHALTAIAA